MHDDDKPRSSGTMIGTGAPVTDAPPAPAGPSATRVTPVAGVQPGTVVFEGRFRILRKVGAGGMGEVFLGEQIALGRQVALKLLRIEWGLDGSAKDRFAREARVLASVDHPSVVRVVDYGEVEGRPCLVLEWVSGELLEMALRQGPLSPARVVSIVKQLADALAAVHERGIVHRDMKPENVMLQDGDRARLLDFGIAKLVENDASSNLTQVGLVVGTPEYISPEQALGLPASPQSDLYSLGVMAYRMLTGELPFEGPSPRAFLTQHIGQPPTPLEKRAPALAAYPTLCALVAKLLDKEPANRPASAAILARQLETILDTRAPLVPVAAERAPLPLQSSSRTFSGESFPALAAPRPVAKNARAKNLALMLTDIKGYTEKTSRQTREESAWMLSEHDRLLIPIVRYYRGRLVQKRGDALLVTFESPTEAIHCGMAMQDRLFQYNSMLPPETQIHVRVCVHAGEVLEAGRELYGEPVQVLAAVEHVADVDQVTFTAAVNLAMTRAEVRSEPCGEIQTPGRPEALSLYRCVGTADGLPFGGRFLPTETVGTGFTLATRAIVSGIAPTATRAMTVVRAAAQTTTVKAAQLYARASATPQGKALTGAATRSSAAVSAWWTRFVTWLESKARKPQ